VRLHAAMGRLDIDADRHKELEQNLRQLTDGDEKLELLATYEELSEEDKEAVKEFVERLSSVVENNLK
jgi:hypothetical protein